MKARQTCLVALRYDDAVAVVSTDTVTHTLQQRSHLENQPAGAKMYTKNTLSEAFQILPYNCHTCLRQVCGN